MVWNKTHACRLHFMLCKYPTFFIFILMHALLLLIDTNKYVKIFDINFIGKFSFCKAILNCLVLVKIKLIAINWGMEFYHSPLGTEACEYKPWLANVDLFFRFIFSLLIFFIHLKTHFSSYNQHRPAYIIKFIHIDWSAYMLMCM